jgi:hypothetical protein
MYLGQDPQLTGCQRGLALFVSLFRFQIMCIDTDDLEMEFV